MPLTNAERQASHRARTRAAVARSITDREAKWLLGLLIGRAYHLLTSEERAQARAILTRGRDGS